MHRGGVELASALALGAGKASQEVLVHSSENVPGAVDLLTHSDPAHEIDQLSEHHLVERRACVVLGQDALERGVVRLDRQHGVVDVLANRCLLCPGLEVRPSGFLRDPEDVLGEVLLGILWIGEFLVEQPCPLHLEGIGDVLQEDEPQGDVLVVGRLHVAA